MCRFECPINQEGVIMDEKRAPTHRRFGEPMDNFINELGDIDPAVGLSYQQLKRMTEICLFISAEDDHGKELIQTSFEAFEHLSEKFPAAAKGIHDALETLTLAICQHSCEMAGAAIDFELSRDKGIAKINSNRKATISRARVIAKQIWSSDVKRIIRIGKMSQIVREALVDEGFYDLPMNKSIADWIRPVAKDNFQYALTGGREKKSAR